MRLVTRNTLLLIQSIGGVGLRNVADLPSQVHDM
jgi:hypothetical protein